MHAARGRRPEEVGSKPAEGVANLEGAGIWRRMQESGRQETFAKKRIDLAQGAPQRALCDSVRKEAGDGGGKCEVRAKRQVAEFSK